MLQHQTGKIFLMEILLTSWFNQIKCASHNLAKGGQCEVTPTLKSSHRTVIYSVETSAGSSDRKLLENGCALKPD